MVDVEAVVAAVQSVVGDRGEELVLLHGPTLGGNAWDYVKECIDTGWVSSAGAYVTRFEQLLAEFTGAKHAVAVVNGTAALHVALLLVGVERGTDVLIPSLTFVATANAVAYCGAMPHFCDVEERTLGMDAGRLGTYLREIAEHRGGKCWNRRTGRRISAVVPMHTFGHPVDLEALLAVAERWGLPIVEDAAESLGSYYRNQHTGTFGRLGILSFNGNKIVTTGGGGAILTDDEELARQARHITTTAKLPHAWEFVHDQAGFNYRMPNLNAALGCAQLEQLPDLLASKRRLAERYREVVEKIEGVKVMCEPEGSKSNYWLNAILLDQPDLTTRDRLLEALNAAKLQSRPIWMPMHRLAMYRECPRMELDVTEQLAQRVVNVPSSAGLGGMKGANG